MIVIHSILDVENNLDGIDGVVFDLDDTLYSEKDYVRSGFHAVAQLFPNDDTFEADLWSAFDAGKPAIDEVLIHRGLKQMKEKALSTYRKHHPLINLYPGVREMLLRLRVTHKLGIITDGRPEGQRAKLNVLKPPVDEIIITDELGGIEFRKPNKAAFLIMQQRFSIPFEKLGYVGDNLKKDFVAPQILGMKCFYFSNPNGLY